MFLTPKDCLFVWMKPDEPVTKDSTRMQIHLSQSVQDSTETIHKRDVLYSVRLKSQKQPQNSDWMDGWKMLLLNEKHGTWDVLMERGSFSLMKKRLIIYLITKKPMKRRQRASQGGVTGEMGTN